MSKPQQISAQAALVSESTLSQLLGYQMKRAFNVIQGDLTQTLKPFELRMLTFTALVFIVDNPGLSQSQLAQVMDIERPNLVIIIDELEQRRLIARNRVQTDRRMYALTATMSGQRLCKKALEAVRKHESQLLNGLDAATTRQLISTLSMLHEHLNHKNNEGKA